MKYDVSIYAVVRAKVANIEAESQTEAIQHADSTVDLEAVIHREFRLDAGHTGVEYVAYADEVENYLVDEVGDDHYKNTTVYDSEGRIVLDDLCLRCGRPWPAPETK